jgi:hypothetical protein
VLDGNVEIAGGVVPGYLAQVRAAGLHGATVLEALRAAVPVEVSEARAHLAKFLFRGDAVGKEVAVLSGGERRRVALCKLLLQQPDLRARFVQDAFEVRGNSPEAFEKYLRAEVGKWAKVVKESGVRVE